MKPLSHVSRVGAVATAILIGLMPVDAQSPAPKAPAAFIRADAIVRIARQRAGSVVFLHTQTPQPGFDELPVVQPIEEGLGSGVVIDATGLILTNAHVIAGAAAVHVRTSDGDDIAATVVGLDHDIDLAVLRASDARGLRPAPLGDSDHLRVGQWVVAIGNPFGLHHTVTAGIISAKARSLDDSGVEFLQTDAAINPGNSGGPLLDLAGTVVGITTGMFSVRGGNVGLNLAIPISIVKEALPHLVRSGEVIHGWIGVTTSPLTAQGARVRGLSGGLVVTGVAADGPADRAGLREGDIVLGLVNDPSLALQDFYRHIRRMLPGTVIRLDAWRNKVRLEVPIEVGRRPTHAPAL